MTKPVRVLFITSSSDMGGTERQVLHLIEHIDSERFPVALLSLEGGGELIRRASEFGILATGPRDGAGIIERRWAIQSCLRIHKPDIVHIFGLRAEVLARGLARGVGARVLSGIRSTDPWRQWYHVALDRLTARHVALFVSNSEAGKESRVKREHFAADRIEVIRNGIVLPDRGMRQPLAMKFRTGLKLKERDAPLISLLGNYRERKGHTIAIAAFERLLVTVPDAMMVFAGADLEGAGVREAVEASQARPRIHVLEFQEDVSPLLAATDITIQPSLFEGTPNSLMESMAWGNPCIASRVGGVPEVMEDGREGLLIPADSPDELLRGMERLIGDRSLARRLGEGARRRMEEEFSLEAMARAHQEVYSRLASGG